MTADFDRIKIAVCTPCQDSWTSHFGQCHAVCMRATYEARPDIEITLIQERGTILPDMRTALVNRALAEGATHILWLDADMTFPPDTILRLLKHGKGVVGTNYTQRRLPCYPVTQNMEGQFVYTDLVSTGLEEVRATGMGVMLVETGIYTALERPWFNGGEVDQTETKGRISSVGEDYYFCYKLAEIGETVWIDHDLTKLIGHDGKYVYTWEDAIRMRSEAMLVRAGVIPAPGEILPHKAFIDCVDLAEKHSPEDLKAWTEAYRTQRDQIEAAEMEAVLGELRRDDEETEAA